MKILFVCSGNKGFILPFIKEQADSLISRGVDIQFFLIKGKGLKAYLHSAILLRKIIKTGDFNLIHAHYGFSGTVACMQCMIPVITTYHGTDINSIYRQIISLIALLKSERNIFVSEKLKEKAIFSRRQIIIPCGVDLSLFYPRNQEDCKKILGLSLLKKYVLFGSAFSNPFKSPHIAIEAAASLGVELLELKEKTREEVALLLNACDVLLMTSKNEGSPQVIKEALACNCPVVATDAGDIKLLTKGIEGCFVVPHEINNVKEALQLALNRNQRINSRSSISHLGLTEISDRILNVYTKCMK